MPVPEAIRKVPRPSNTIVQDMGHDGPKRYAVRSRKSVKYVAGGNPQPVNGKTIGYIIDYKFVPLPSMSSPDSLPPLSYGGAALAESVCGDLVDDLLAVYPPEDAYTILSVAALKVLHPHISDNHLESAYRRSFLSVFYPDAALSADSLDALYRKLSKDAQKREIFFARRMQAVGCAHPVAIACLPLNQRSGFPDLASFSCQSESGDREAQSVLYAYDMEKKEPVCARVFSEAPINTSSYLSFLRDYSVANGILVCSKDFPSEIMKAVLAENKALHYWMPVHQNDARILEPPLPNCCGVVHYEGRAIPFRKTQPSAQTYLYAFQASENADRPESRCEPDRPALCVYESDLDVDAETAYACCAHQRTLALVFHVDQSSNRTGGFSVHGDDSVHGRALIHFIRSVITCRILNVALSANLLRQMTYGALIEALNGIWRKSDVPPERLPGTEDSSWVHVLPIDLEILVQLGLCSASPKKEPRRSTSAGLKNPKKSSDRSETKRPVGRPRKVPDSGPGMPKRSVGRPRKQVPVPPGSNAENA